jgi:hypothetical protein
VKRAAAGAPTIFDRPSTTTRFPFTKSGLPVCMKMQKWKGMEINGPVALCTSRRHPNGVHGIIAFSNSPLANFPAFFNSQYLV